MTTRFTLLLEPGSPKPDNEIGDILAEHLGLHPTDAVAHSRYCGGILVNSAEEDRVETIVQCLEKIDVKTRAVPLTLLEGLPRGFRANSMELLEETISMRISGGREVLVLESDLRGIQIHAITGEPDEEADSAADSFQVPLFSALKEGAISPRALKILDWVEESGRPPPRFIFTLYAREPFGPIHFDRTRTDYSILGSDKLSHSMDNFILLAEMFINRYPGLLNRERVCGFLDHLDPEKILYFKREEAQKFDRWLQAWIRLEDLMRIPRAKEGQEESSTEGPETNV